ncbi:MAG: TolB family protein [Desulfatibacillaceae bacterium]
MKPTARTIAAAMALVLMAVAAPGVCPAIDKPQKAIRYPGDLSGRIVFSAVVDGQWDLWAANPDNGELVRMTNDPGMERFCDVSDGGDRILYIAEDKAVWLYEPYKGTRTRLPLVTGIYGHPSWAPGAREFAYVAYKALPTDSSELWRMREKDGQWEEPERLTTFPPMVMHPDYSPDGKTIACTVFRRDPVLGVVEKPVLLRPPSDKLAAIVDESADSYGPKWSPDGVRIAYTSNLAGNYDVWILDMDKNENRRLTIEPGFDGEPSFGPRGKQVVFVSNRSGARELWIDSAQGGMANRLTHLEQSVSSPCWVKPRQGQEQ